MVRFLIPKHTLPTAPSVPTGPFKTHTSTSGISVSSNPFLAHRRGDRLWHASSSYVPPRRRAKNALHYRLVNQARHRELKAGKIGLPVCPSALKQSVQGLCRPFPRNQFAQKTGRPILEIRIGAYHAGVAVPLILDIQPV